MRRTEQKRNFSTGAFTGLLVTAISFGGLLCLLTVLLRRGSIGDSLLRLLLPLCCLLSGTAGALSSSRKRGDRILSLLLTGVVPSGCLLCCGLFFAGADAGSSLLWNAAAFLLPALAALLPGKKNTRRRS